MMKGISIIIPCFNEEMDVLVETIEQINSAFEKIHNWEIEIIIVNDGSSKNYSELIFNNKVSIIDHQENMGYGASLKTGIIRAKHEYIGIIDADGTYPVKDFEGLVKHLEKYDMVIGARRWKHISWIRLLPKFVLTRFASFLADFNIIDLNSGMRVFKKKYCLEFWKLYPNGFSFTSTITMAFLTNGYQVKFSPIEYYKRIGKSSIHPIKDTIGFFSLVARLTLYFNPLRFFIPLSLVFIVLAIVRGLRDYFQEGAFGGLTLVLFFMGFQVFFFGLLAEIINKK
jgi:glycosyltransferase involved in cell wall biosynthesis